MATAYAMELYRDAGYAISITRVLRPFTRQSRWKPMLMAFR